MASAYFLSLLNHNHTLTTCSCMFRVTTEVKDFMPDNSASLEIIVFECDKCGKEHVVENALDFTALSDDDRVPKEWMYIRFGEMCSEEPVDSVLCEECKLDFLTAVGFTSAMEYAAVVASNKKSEPTMSAYKRSAILRFVFKVSGPTSKTALDVN